MYKLISGFLFVDHCWEKYICMNDNKDTPIKVVHFTLANSGSIQFAFINTSEIRYWRYA